MTSSAPTVASTWRSRTRSAWRAAARLGFSLQDMAFLVIATGEDSEHGGAVDASEYQLCANLHAGRMQLAGQGAPVPAAVHVVRADPDPTRRRRHRRAGRIRERREGQAHG